MELRLVKRILTWIQPSRCSENYPFDMFGLTATLNYYLCDGFTDTRCVRILRMEMCYQGCTMPI